MAYSEFHCGIAHRAYRAGVCRNRPGSDLGRRPRLAGLPEQSYQHVCIRILGKEIYLGVRLGQRGLRSQLSGGVMSAVSGGVYARGGMTRHHRRSVVTCRRIAQ